MDLNITIQLEVNTFLTFINLLDCHLNNKSCSVIDQGWAGKNWAGIINLIPKLASSGVTTELKKFFNLDDKVTLQQYQSWVRTVEDGVPNWIRVFQWVIQRTTKRPSI